MTVAENHGASAYFSKPEHALDPALFSADGRLNPDIRDYVLSHLFDFFRWEGIQVGNWLHTWLAGSGISYQWKASRGNGDLDVLLGVDLAVFSDLNPEFAAGSRQQLAATVNEQMKKYLWPLTAQARFGESTYEVTYYWNPEVSDDITVIRPYAAWNLDDSQWDVLPDPHPPVWSFPDSWHTATVLDAGHVRSLYSIWSQHLADVMLLPPSNPSSVTAAAGLKRVTAELRSVWDLLHNGRRSAFTADGQGWADWHNYRWQAAKANGTIDLLREVIAEDDHRRAAEDTRLYGGPIQPGELALRRAASRYSRWAGR